MDKYYRYSDIVEALHNYARMAINEDSVEVRTEVVATVLRILDNVAPVKDHTADELKKLWRDEIKEKNKIYNQLGATEHAYYCLYSAIENTGIRFNYDDGGNITGAYLPWRYRLFFRKGWKRKWR